MRRTLTRLLMLALLAQVSVCSAAPYFPIRSQSTNVAREMVGSHNDINLCNNGSTYGTFNTAIEFAQSFRKERIARRIFGNDITCLAKKGASISQ